MSASTNIKSGGLVTLSIKVSGKSIPDTYDIQGVEIEKGVNTISIAKISIIDGDPSTGQFKASSSSDFTPGNEIAIEAGYDATNSLLFKGIITKQSIRIQGNEGALLQLECKDAAVKMTVGKKNISFANKSDSDIIKSIVNMYGIAAKVSATATQWPKQIRHNISDWDFIINRAEANGMVVTTLNGEVAVFPPNKDTKPVLKVEYGDNLFEFNADLNVVNQLGSVKASSWNYKTQELIDATSKSTLKGPGNLSTTKLSEVVGLKDYELQTTAPLDEAVLTNWTKAEVVKSEYAKIQGEVKFQGTHVADPGKYITLNGLGTRFNGDHFISGVVHTIENGNWITEVSIGLSTNWSSIEVDVMATAASTVLSGVKGLCNGTVKKISEDPDGQYRILVDVPLFDAKGEGVWARLSNVYATSGAGVFFLPEINDEVVLGFLNEDPRFPIILGSLYSNTKNKPFEGLEPNEKNTTKAIVSKSGIHIKFNDEDKVLTIETPDKNTIVLNDKEKTINIKDINDNTIVMDNTGITIKTAKDINFIAQGNINLNASSNIEMKAVADAKLDAMRITQNAKTSFTAKGNASAELSASGQTTVKGAMVMIN